MKTSLLPDVLRTESTSPSGLALLSVVPPLARPWAETAARLSRALEDGIDLARVRALQQAIAAGRYFVDADRIAEGILATPAPARNH